MKSSDATRTAVCSGRSTRTTTVAIATELTEPEPTRSENGVTIVDSEARVEINQDETAAEAARTIDVEGKERAVPAKVLPEADVELLVVNDGAPSHEATADHRAAEAPLARVDP